MRVKNRVPGGGGSSCQCVGGGAAVQGEREGERWPRSFLCAAPAVQREQSTRGEYKRCSVGGGGGIPECRQKVDRGVDSSGREREGGRRWAKNSRCRPKCQSEKKKERKSRVRGIFCFLRGRARAPHCQGHGAASRRLVTLCVCGVRVLWGTRTRTHTHTNAHMRVRGGILWARARARA